MFNALGISTIEPPALHSLMGNWVVRCLVAYKHYKQQIADINNVSTEEKKVFLAGLKAYVEGNLPLSLTDLEEFSGASTLEKVTEERVLKWAEISSRRTTDNMPGQAENEIARIRFWIDKDGPDSAMLAFCTDLMTELRWNRVHHVGPESAENLDTEPYSKITTGNCVRFAQGNFWILVQIEEEGP